LAERKAYLKRIRNRIHQRSQIQTAKRNRPLRRLG